jgi:hypothetical protein
MFEFKKKEVSMPSPYIVFGTSRSGTSFVTGTLNDELGISMGEYFVPAVTGFNEQGSPYECGALRAVTNPFVEGKTSLLEFYKDMSDYIKKRETENERWGFKDHGPIMSYCYFMFFENPKLIICEREENLVRQSLRRLAEYQGYRDNENDDVERYINQRMILSQRVLKRLDPSAYLHIYFDGMREMDKQEIVDKVKDRWPDDFKS